jgi:outer membrane protein
VIAAVVMLAAATPVASARTEGLQQDPRYRLPVVASPEDIDASPDESLASAIEDAYRTSPVLGAARYDVRAVDEGLAQARATLRPQLGLEVGSGYDRTVPGRATQAARPLVDQLTDPIIGRNDVAVQATLTQPIWTGGRGAAAIAAAEGDIRAARAGLRGQEGDLLAQVAGAYVDVRRDTATVAIRRTNLATLRATLAEVVARRGAGELTRTDVAQVQTQLAAAQAAFTASEAQLEDSRAQFTALVGRPPRRLALEPALPLVPVDVDAAFDLAAARSPDLARALETERASRARIAAARAERSPSLALRGSARLAGEAFPYELTEQDQNFAGRLVLTVPLFQGGLVSSRIAEAKDRNTADRFRIEVARRQAFREVLGAWNQYVASKRNVEVQELQVTAASVFAEGTTAEYRQGLRSTFDVLFAQNGLRDAQIGLLASKRDAYVAQILLLRQIGQLEVGRIVTGVPLYDPAANTRAAMRRGALPWDGAIRALDGLGGLGTRQQLPERPARAVTPVAVAPADAAPADPELARDMPMTPIPGTAGRSVGPK